jgi:hypothetical protein
VNGRTVDLPQLCRRATLATIDEEARTVELTFSTGAAVTRSDWWSGKRWIEKLSMDPKHVRLDRLNAGAPLLNAHSGYSLEDQIGVVEDGSARIQGKKGIATVRFSARESVEPIFRDVKDKIIRNVSVGYIVHKFEETTGEDGSIPVRTAIDWEPYEISMVPMPADAGAQTRSGKKPQVDTYPCEILIRGASAPALEPDHKEPVMDRTTPESIAEPNPLRPDPPPATPPPAEPNDRDRGVTQERERVEGIRQACRAGRMTREFETDLITSGVSLVEAQARVFKVLEGRDPDVPKGPTGRTEVTGEDPLVHVRAGIANAILNRIAADRFKLEDIGRKYRGMSMLDIGRAFLNARGLRTTHMTRSELVDAMLATRAGYHTTSDFPMLLEDVANKNLRAAYEAAPQTWGPISKSVSISDFKPSRQLQIGDAPSLDEVLEHGEFQQGTIAEAKEAVQLKTYGKIFAITRQALINDDLNAFGEVPAAFGRKARDKESDLAWAQITSNPNMGDGVALFHTASHGNLAAAGAVISVTTLGAGRAAMRIQKGLDGVTLLNLTTRYLIVPAAIETVADQNVTQITPAQASNASPFTSGGRTPLTVIVEPRLDVASATAWYLACSVDQAPVLYYATLDGQSGPEVRQMEGFDVDGVKFRARIDVAFKAADWRAIYKNPGA